MFEEAENLLLKHLRKCRVKHIRSVQRQSHKSLDFNSKQKFLQQKIVSTMRYFKSIKEVMQAMEEV